MMRICYLGAAGLLALADADRLQQDDDGTDAMGFFHNFGDGDGGAPPPPALSFAPQFDDFAVLQQKSGGDAWVYGTSTGTAAVTVKVSGTGCASLTVTAEMAPLADEPAVPGRLFVSTKAPPPPPTGNKWKAKVPGAMGGDCTITATDGTHTATIQHVTYGDVWYCGGQSNMALPLSNTFSRFKTESAIAAGKYSNIRIKQMSTNMNPAIPWSTLKNASGTNIVAGGWGGANTSALFHFSSTCYYFGESLTDELGTSAPPIGLIHTAWGGSMIEQWLPAETVDSCKLSCSNATTCGVSEWWNTRILPYAGMTLKGWVWYQGENNMHQYFGNSADQSGYSCLAVKLISQWREIWSKSSGTAPDAPFGVVTLPPSGSEGGADIRSMGHAQTGSWGIMPNPDMPNTFVAQAYDLDDPVGSLGCYHAGCCGNLTKDKTPACAGCLAICNGWSAGVTADPSDPTGPGVRTCPSPSAGPSYLPDACAPVYMGPIHGRDKKPVGDRLARACATLVYAKAGAWTGPTITGCKKSGNTITISFNSSILNGDTMEVQPYNASVIGASQMAVLINSSNFCFQTGTFPANADTSALTRGSPSPTQPCAYDGFGKTGGVSDETADWVQVDIKEGSAPNTVEVDLTKAKGVAFGIRYGWLNGGACCSKMTAPGDVTNPNAQMCPIKQCPLMLKTSGLPANPFMAKITTEGKCECMPPQKCDA